jgi:protein MpaA
MAAGVGALRLLGCLAVCLWMCGCETGSHAGASSATGATTSATVTGSSPPARPSEDEAPIHLRVRIGTSVRGRALWAYWRGDGDAGRRLLVVGCIHGDEPAGIPVAGRLLRLPPPPQSVLVVVPDLNPDGVAAATRTNADGVDLNRNFPYRWQPMGSPGSLHYAGPRPLSEPESRAAAALILRLQPTVSVWFHQALDLVDKSGGRASVERRFARLADLSLARLPRYPGSVSGWENHRLASGTAFVVELPGGQLTGAGVARFADAVDDLMAPSTTTLSGEPLLRVGAADGAPG